MMHRLAFCGCFSGEAFGDVRSGFIAVKRVMDNEGDFEEVGIVKSLQITHKK